MWVKRPKAGSVNAPIDFEYESFARLGSSQVRFLVVKCVTEMRAAYPDGNVTEPAVDSRLIVARHHGFAIGFIAWQVVGEYAFVDMVWVRDSYRREGIYTGMLKLLIAEAGTLGASSGIANVAWDVAWDNATSRAVHTKLFGRPRVIQFEQSFKNLLRSGESNGREVSASVSTDGMHSSDRHKTEAGSLLQPGVPAEGSPRDEEER